MPTQKNRINLTLDDDLFVLIDDLSNLTGTPKAKLVSELIRDCYPALDMVRKSLKDIEAQKKALPHLARLSAHANIEMAKVNLQMADLFEGDSK